MPAEPILSSRCRAEARLALSALRMEAPRMALVLAAVVGAATLLLVGADAAAGRLSAWSLVALAGGFSLPFGVACLSCLTLYVLAAFHLYLMLEARGMRLTVPALIAEVPAAVLLDDFHERTPLLRR